jgi:phosphoglucomutase
LQLESIAEKFKEWTENEYFDSQTRSELLALQVKEENEEIEDRFYTDLEFGTGGIRGVMGAGTNRINKYVIRKITQGLAETIQEEGPEAYQRGVVIAYDSRHNSDQYALETASVLTANFIKVYFFDSLRPTPELSFAVRYFKAIAGVNITASHNPKEYSGYKVYWEDGGQIPPWKAKQIAEKIFANQGWQIPTSSKEEAYRRGLWHSIGRDIDEAYGREVKNQLLNPELAKTWGSELKIVYTPLHGTGAKIVPEILKDLGFSSLFIVPEEEKPDGDFPTVKYPNPEDPLAFERALAHAPEQKADLILATDPDADRLGIYARDKEGVYQRFTGNQIGVVLEYYLLSQRTKLKTMPSQPIIIKTVVTTELAEHLAHHYGAEVINVLVGFKYIGEQIKKIQESGQGTFLLGFEESHGYLTGTYARDKDAIAAAALLAEAALYYRKEENKTLPDVLEEILARFGYYGDEQYALTLEGREGKESIAKIMGIIRSAKPGMCGGLKVARIDDFLTKRSYFPVTNKEGVLDSPELPPEDVLRLCFQGGGFLIARPSGTEPKIRFYFCIKGENPQELKNTMERVKTDFLELIEPCLPSQTVKI